MELGLDFLGLLGLGGTTSGGNGGITPLCGPGAAVE